MYFQKLNINNRDDEGVLRQLIHLTIKMSSFGVILPILDHAQTRHEIDYFGDDGDK